MTPHDVWELISRALTDASLAERLVDDPAYRRWLRDDPGNALLVFHLVRAYDVEAREAASLRRERLERLILATEEQRV